MQGQTAVVIGSTGLIGSQVLQLLLEDPAFSTVRILVRSPVSISHPKLDVQLVDFNNYIDIKEKISSGHSIFCCIGTTQSKVKGDKQAYRKVDFDIPVNTANAGIENGFKKYLIVSSVGANAASRNFYLQLKGSVEDAIAKLAFESIHIFRPSLLLGDRKESRPAEKFAQGGMQLLSFVFLGPLKKYRAIQSSDVAKAMVAAAKEGTKGVKVHHYGEMTAQS